jgi:thiol-disulfide isomerase/thioredoxin
MTLAAAPDFVLPSASGAPVALLAGRPTLLLFVSEECPTRALTLRRLAPLASEPAAAGPRIVAVFEDPLEVAARVAR